MSFKLKHFVLALPFTLYLTACEDKSAQIGCSHEVAQKTLIEILSKEAYKALSDEVDEFKEITSQNKRSALETLKLAISEITTTSKDSSSTMKTCEATVALSIPAENYGSLSDLFKELTGNNLDRYLEDNALQQNANSFSKRVEYTVQPTDDAKTVFVKTLDNDIASAMGTVASLVTLKPVIEQQKREKAEQKFKADMEAKQAEERQKEAQKQREQERMKAEEAARNTPSQSASQPAVVSSNGTSTQTQSGLSEARSRYLATDTELNRIWGMLDKAQKQALLPAQRQWIKSKDAICGQTSMKGSESAMIEMFKCQKEMTEARIAELR